MAKIIIAVGSTRRPKLNAVSEAVESFAPLLSPGAEYEVTGVEVPSGVSHTPSSRDELMSGARRRAEALLDLAHRQRQPWDYFVGLEGGLDVTVEGGSSQSVASALPPANGRRVFLESWAYVGDGTRGFFGHSGGVEIPAALAHEVLENGVELSDAIDRFAGATGVRDAQGAWGVLSRNLITRQGAFRVAVIAAFAPFYNEKLYRSVSAAGATL